MSFNGSGSFIINSAGQPVVANTVISATVFNALTADLATGLTTCLTKDGQSTPTANIPLGTYKITGLGAGTAATDAARVDQVQSTAAKLITPTGTDTITGTMSPALTAYAAGQLFYFIAAGANTGAVTINIDGLGAKSITRDGATALIAGDISSGEIVVICYDGTRFQMINAANSFGNTTVNGTLTVTGNTALQANVSIVSALSVGGVCGITGAVSLASTLAVTGKSDLVTVSTASMNAAVALLTTATVTSLTATGASVASANIGVANVTTKVVTPFVDAASSAGGALRNASGTTQVQWGAGGGSNFSVDVAGNLNPANANISIAPTGSGTVTINPAAAGTMNNVAIGGTTAAAGSFTTATLSGNLTLNGGTINGVLYLNGSKVATSGSVITYNGTAFGVDSAAVFNDSGADVDFRIESDTDTHCLFVDASANNVGIGTSGPSAKLHVVGSTGIRVDGGSSNTAVLNLSASTTPSNGVTIGSNYDGTGSYGPLNFVTSGTIQMVLTASGNLGLGVTPSAWSGLKGFQINSQASIAADGNSTQVSCNAFYDGSVWKYIATDEASNYYQLNGTHVWRTAASGTAGNTITWTQAMEINASGGLQCRNTIGVGNATPAASGAGVTFPASQSASSDANTLDDYEEGTFTPTVVGLTSAGTGTYASQVGKYTKIGNLVTVQVFLQWSAHTGTGQMVFGGLPFNGITTSGYNSAASVSYVNNISLTANNVLTVHINFLDNTTLNCWQYPVGGGGATTVPIDTAAAIICTCTYETA